MRLSHPVQPKRRFNLTPLIDVVFLLLVFFLLASTFMRFSSLPLSHQPERGASQKTPPKIILVHVLADGLLNLNGESVATRELAPKVKALLARLRKPASPGAQGGSPVVPAIKTIVTPKTGATLQQLVAALSQLRRLGLSDIVVAR